MVCGQCTHAHELSKQQAVPFSIKNFNSLLHFLRSLRIFASFVEFALSYDGLRDGKLRMGSRFANLHIEYNCVFLVISMRNIRPSTPATENALEKNHVAKAVSSVNYLCHRCCDVDISISKAIRLVNANTRRHTGRVYRPGDCVGLVHWYTPFYHWPGSRAA
jgi:hypothetical protein